MMKFPVHVAFTAVVAAAVLTKPVQASFHDMQIEEIIAGVNGDTSAQAIQLRMRAAGQNLLLTGAPNAPAVLRVWDANGLNPITLITFDSNVTNGALGDTVLVTSANFSNDVTPGFSGALRSSTNTDFVLTNTIPASYLAAGKLTYEESTGTILWSLAWGGANYLGSTGGVTFFNGGPDPGKFGSALPSSGLSALLFQGAANGTNTNNATDYAITAGAATFTDNSHGTFSVVPEPSVSALVLLSVGIWTSFQSMKKAKKGHA